MHKQKGKINTMHVDVARRKQFYAWILPIFLLSATLSSLFIVLSPARAGAVAVGDACSYSADGKIYTGKIVDLNGVNFCDASTNQSTTSSTSTSNSSSSVTCTPASTSSSTYTCNPLTNSTSTSSSSSSTTMNCTKTGTSTSLTCTPATSSTGTSTSTSTTSTTQNLTCTPATTTGTTSTSTGTSAAQNLSCTSATGTAAGAAGAATNAANNTKTACTRSGDTGKDLNSYLDACGGKQQIRLTKAKANKGEKVPAIILVHGGGWFSDDGNFSPTFQKRIAKWGFTTMRIKYRLMPGGVQEQLWDVQRAIRHVRENADKYGIDKNRIAVWGDSAGGSLAVRAGATGVTGVKAAVGWSAPTNAFRDLFNSYDGWLAGLYHSRCIGKQLPAYTTDVINAFGRGGVGAAFDVVAKNVTLTPQQSLSLLNSGLSLANTSLTQLDESGKLQKTSDGIGYTATNTTDSSTTSSDTKAAESETARERLKTELSNMTPSELTALGVSIYQFTRSAQGITTEDATTNETISLITNVANIITKTQTEVQNEKDTSGTTATATGSSNPNASSIVSDIFTASGIDESAVKSGAQTTTQAGKVITDGANALGINTQINPAQKIAECIDDFVDLSPALYASPRSPQMLLVGAAKERWVNPLDAYQMRDKLRSMGKVSDALVLPATNSKKVYKTNKDGHMGYDQRAEVPTLSWLHKLLKSKTDSQR